MTREEFEKKWGPALASEPVALEPNKKYYMTSINLGTGEKTGEGYKLNGVFYPNTTWKPSVEFYK